MKEIVIISGKGGTGKTSLVASFAALAEAPVIVDCDVDASDLHLIMDPVTLKSEEFKGGKLARVRTGHCTACGKCEEVCRYDAVFFDGPGNGRVSRTFRIDPAACEGCGVCHWFCDYQAIAFEERIGGRWFISDTRHGPMLHALMSPGAENSGKLVSLLRMKAKELAKAKNREVILIDGSPGIGCPVIASITGADHVVIVTEPTPSGVHDFRRAADLAAFFHITACTVVNKWDLNRELTELIKEEADHRGIVFAGTIAYDNIVTEAQLSKKSIVEYTQGGIARQVRDIWTRLGQTMTRNQP
ncbi:ATP-binding protein [bacterium]|nr:ATP-binding protein [candidate division CSSED10-310 bacterium]